MCLGWRVMGRFCRRNGTLFFSKAILIAGGFGFGCCELCERLCVRVCENKGVRDER